MILRITPVIGKSSHGEFPSKRSRNVLNGAGLMTFGKYGWIHWILQYVVMKRDALFRRDGLVSSAPCQTSVLTMFQEVLVQNVCFPGMGVCSKKPGIFR